MNKIYESPKAIYTCFAIQDVMTTSPGEPIDDHKDDLENWT